jgi:hypothetical protein
MQIDLELLHHSLLIDGNAKLPKEWYTISTPSLLVLLWSIVCFVPECHAVVAQCSVVIVTLLSYSDDDYMVPTVGTHILMHNFVGS